MVSQWKLQGNKPISCFFPAQSRQNMKGFLDKSQAEEKALTDSHGHEQNSQDAITFVALLKACAKQKDLHKGRNLHREIATNSGLLQRNVFIGSALVSMYAKCGALDKAQEVFDDLLVRNEVSWNALIAGYVQHGHGEEALNYFECMQSAGFSPNAFTYTCILKACGSLRALDKGQEIHAQIVREHLIEKDIVVASALVDMYIKCGVLEKAQEVFDEAPIQDKVLWTALIAGYAQYGYGEEAIRCFERMQLGGFIPDAVTFACILTACSSIGAYNKGEEIHAQIVRQCLLKKDILTCTALVDMYAKCEAFEKAQEVFNEIGMRSAILWNALIAGHAQHEKAEDSLTFFRRMQVEGFCPTSVTFACTLKACGSLGLSEKGQEIHAQIAREHLPEEDTMVGNAVIDMYAKCGLLKQAEEVFDKLLVHDKASWTALITGYAQHGHVEEALYCFEQMQMGGFSPDAVTFSCVLKACGSIGALTKGEEIHAQIVREQSVKGNIVVANALLDMYTKCGAFGKAQEVFNSLLDRDVVSWNVLLTGHFLHGHCEEALDGFEQMQLEGFSPDQITLACILKACTSIGAARKGEAIHVRIIREGFLRKDIVLGNALVGMYAKCGAFEMAKKVFDELPLRDKFSWTALIGGYCQHGLAEEAVRCFEQMKHEGLSPDGVTLLCILQAYGSLGAVDKGKELHAEIVSEGLLGKDGVLGTALVDMYVKCRSLAHAQEAFDELLVHDLVSWTALIAGYTQQGLGEEALDCFEQMQRDGLSPNAVTLVCILSACGSIGAAEKGIEIHSEIMRKGLLEKNCVLGNALLDMYAKCGALAQAQQVFGELSICDVVSWNVLFAGYAHGGQHEIVFEMFSIMVGQGVEPNQVTFLILLSACSHLGLVNEGEAYFEAMSTSFGIVPVLEHLSCMVDLYVDAGLFDQAMVVMEKISPSDRFLAWSILLDGCQKWGNVKLGRLAFEHAVKLDVKSSVIYLSMIKIYAAAGMKEDADKIEAMRLQNEAWKNLGGFYRWPVGTKTVNSFRF